MTFTSPQSQHRPLDRQNFVSLGFRGRRQDPTTAMYGDPWQEQRYSGD
jgi:hypothetical protein